MVISDLGRAIFGVTRDSIGDLHNLQLDFDVVSGEGEVVPYTISTDNGSGDQIVRVEWEALSPITLTGCENDSSSGTSHVIPSKGGRVGGARDRR